MNSIITSTTGLVHFISGLVALITGTTILVMKKGTNTHKKVGYIYCFSMIVLIITAFMIYRLFGGWGIFHWAALVSTITLLAGMIPPVFLRHTKYWLSLHFNSMYWSVFGLYGAFVAESAVRIPDTTFFWMVGLAVFVVMTGGAIGFGIYSKKWKKKFNI